MAEPLRLFILAGEPSGDRLGAHLIAGLRARVPLALTGVGGSAMIAEGLTPLFPMGDLSVMGFADVAKRLPKLLWRLEQTARAVLKSDPDVVVLIDAQVFSQEVAKRLRKRGFTKPILLYVAPTVWAHAPERAARLKPVFDEFLAVLPFEPAKVLALGGPPTLYVGHPAVAEASIPSAPLPRGQVALLPGSRQGELARHLPVFRALAESLARHQAVTGLFLPTLPELQARLSREIASWPVKVDLIVDRGERARRYGQTILAVSSAGTATLELALKGVPTLVTYVMDARQAKVFEAHGRPPVSLPNIILEHSLLPELVRAQLGADAVVEAARGLLDEPARRQAQVDGFARLLALMAADSEGRPAIDPAERVLHHAGRG